MNFGWNDKGNANGTDHKNYPIMIEIDPTVDFAWKMLLGNPDYPVITIHFLNAILRLDSPIVAVEIVNPIVLQEFETDKLSILDILAIDDVDRRLNVEVQQSSRQNPKTALIVVTSTATLSTSTWFRQEPLH